jgi:hypothetical protein
MSPPGAEGDVTPDPAGQMRTGELGEVTELLRKERKDGQKDGRKDGQRQKAPPRPASSPRPWGHKATRGTRGPETAGPKVTRILGHRPAAWRPQLTEQQSPMAPGVTGVRSGHPGSHREAMTSLPSPESRPPQLCPQPNG